MVLSSQLIHSAFKQRFRYYKTEVDRVPLSLLHDHLTRPLSLVCIAIDPSPGTHDLRFTCSTKASMLFCMDARLELPVDFSALDSKGAISVNLRSVSSSLHLHFRNWLVILVAIEK